MSGDDTDLYALGVCTDNPPETQEEEAERAWNEAS